MDGTKRATDTLNPETDMVGRCSAGAEDWVKIQLNPVETRILPVVAAKFGENPSRLNRLISYGSA